MAKQIIVIQKGDYLAVWGNITDVCKAYDFSYSYVKGLKFPITYRGYTINKLPYKQK